MTVLRGALTILASELTIGAPDRRACGTASTPPSPQMKSAGSR